MMTKTEFKEGWWAMMRKRLDTDDAGVSEYMRQNQLKGNLNRKGKKGGFSDPTIARKASQLGVEAKRAKTESDPK